MLVSPAQLHESTPFGVVGLVALSSPSERWVPTNSPTGRFIVRGAYPGIVGAALEHSRVSKTAGKLGTNLR